MIDSGATMNAMSPEAARQCKIQVRKKAQPYPLVLIDGQPHSQNGGQVDHETETVTMVTLRGHMEDITFDVIPLGQHAIVLGSPWLQAHNPTIDWWEEMILMNACSCKGATTPELKREDASLGQKKNFVQSPKSLRTQPRPHH